ncbi:MAG TPA: hypothetical protein VOA87_06185 [Thermoanaerobaculia bacterium]|nr:hypothetical protein [Thermoanaerobaculia bacterium]
MEPLPRPPTVFLLSPASPAGVRARQLASARAQFPTALRFRSPEGVPVAEAFAFLSALYFRGKIAYARRFATPPEGLATGAFVIAPGFGLVPPDWPLTPERLKKLRRTPVDLASRAYHRPLRQAALELAGQLGEHGRAVLLGSIATGKYVDVLLPVLGARLLYPRPFLGTGDMRRGSLMLRAARSGEELEYSAVESRARRRS